MYRLPEWLLPFLAGVLMTLAITYVSKFFQHTKSVDVEVAEAHHGQSLAGASEITCTYPRVLYARFWQEQVTHGLPKTEESPSIFTFSAINRDVAQLKYLDATKTISEVPIVKIHEDNEKIVFVDGTGDAYVSTHMIFKNEGVAVYTKAVSLIGIPSGSLAVGTCVGY